MTTVRCLGLRLSHGIEASRQKGLLVFAKTGLYTCSRRESSTVNGTCEMLEMQS